MDPPVTGTVNSGDKFNHMGGSTIGLRRGESVPPAALRNVAQKAVGIDGTNQITVPLNPESTDGMSRN